MSPRMRRALIWAPALVLASTTIAFATLPALLGRRTGYLAGFLFYWIVWCALFSLFVLKPRGLAILFRWRWADSPSLNLLLLLPPLLPAAFVLPQRLPEASGAVVGVSAVLAIVNGTLEEVFWRGAYLAAFPRRITLGVLYPAIGFAFWHITPQLVVPSARLHGVLSFFFVSLLLGLAWGAAAWRSRSIFGSVLSHIVTDFVGLGAVAYLR